MNLETALTLIGLGAMFLGMLLVFLGALLVFRVLRRRG